MELPIRPATVHDVRLMHAIRLSVQENLLSDPDSVTEASYLPFLAAGAAWVAESDRDIEGFAAVEEKTKSVWALFVRPGQEGRGIGSALQHRMLEWATTKGIDTLRLTTSPGTRADAFYRRSGWAACGMTADGDIRFERKLS